MPRRPSEHEHTDLEERPRQYVQENEEEAEEDHMAPTTWWVTSTLFPLAAATFGPVATAFNICALAMAWRKVAEPASMESEGTSVPDPTW